MATLARRTPYSINTWPGFVDALAALLIVVIFLLMVFVLAQFFLNEALTGRDEALMRLETRVSELNDLLGLERNANEDMRANVAQLSDDLQASLAVRDDLRSAIRALTDRATAAESRVEDLATDLSRAQRTVAADKRAIDEQTRRLNQLLSQVAALQALKEELEREALALGRKAEDTEARLIEERELSNSARAQVALLNKQLTALREQLGQLSAALDASELKAVQQEEQIATLGQRLNAALAERVQELASYRSEFFGRLRQVLGDQEGIRVVGDRFVFQSEVLFESGSSELDEEGRQQLSQVADSIRELQDRIPDDLPWVLQVNGHTDSLPIQTPAFASNWELSAARALSVVNLLIERGIPPNRLAAAGFGEFQPLVEGSSPEDLRRNRRIELKLTRP
ncbi:MAG: peptidoglycan -binding protein [Rhodospirillales bacterium]|nr:peptidoglycan -binding protein [Rhodospirillales bacterium]